MLIRIPRHIGVAIDIRDIAGYIVGLRRDILG